MAKVKVLEVDQWTSTAKNIEEMSFADFDITGVRGGDSEAIRAIGIARAKIREVEESCYPPKGRVWYKEGPDGKLEFWKENYDSD